MHRMAIHVVGGFLGAGKTTLLNEWLQAESTARVAVLVNDFGSLNIDAELLSSRQGNTIALSNGCICCQMGGDLTQALIRILEQPQPLDEVWIEASGVSDPGRIARLARAIPEFDVQGVIVVVDCTALAAQLEDRLLADTVATQIQSADCLLLSKTDLASASQVERSRQSLGQLNPRAICLDSRLNDTLATLKESVPVSAEAKPWLSQQWHERRFTAWTGRPQLTLPVHEWRRRLCALPGQVLRLKGFVRTLEHGWSALQLAGRSVEVKPCATVPDAGSSLVAIAVRGSLPREALDGLLHV